MEKEFPTLTCLLCAVYIIAFLLVQARPDYAQVLGFKASSFKPYTLLTYMFIHTEISHLLFNIVMLISVGFILERAIGAAPFLTIYLSSGFLSASFDCLGRALLGIPVSSPLLGSSGGIFGLLTILALLRPFEKLPSFLIFTNLIPLLIPISEFGPILANPILFLLIFSLFLLLIFLVFVLKPFLPILYAFLFYFILWLIFLLIQPEKSISYFGHAGGIFGGLFAFTLFNLIV
jgi:membrane associated rhomboid family serine protease